MSFIGCNPLSIQVHLFLGGTISSGLCPSDIPPWQSEILFCVNENAKDGSAHYQLPSKSIQPSFLMLPAPVLPLGIEISIQCSPPTMRGKLCRSRKSLRKMQASSDSAICSSLILIKMFLFNRASNFSVLRRSPLRNGC